METRLRNLAMIYKKAKGRETPWEDSFCEDLTCLIYVDRVAIVSSTTQPIINLYYYRKSARAVEPWENFNRLLLAL